MAVDVGVGPIGLAAILTARLYSPSHIIAIDQADTRLEAAKRFGADIVARPDEDPIETIRSITGGLGADVAIEAVGVPATFALCTTLIRPGGRVANIGVHAQGRRVVEDRRWSSWPTGYRRAGLAGSGGVDMSGGILADDLDGLCGG